MTIDEALAITKAGRLGPVYLLTGPADFWAERWLRRARHALLGDGCRENYYRFEGRMAFREVLLTLSSGGFFGQRKMAVIQDGRWDKKEASLEAYLEAPIPDTLLVIRETKSSAPLERMMGNHRTIQAQPATPAAFRHFVKEEVTARDLVLSGDGLEAFLALSAGDEYHAIEELDKMRLYDPLHHWRGDDVRSFVIPVHPERQIWDVTDAFIRRDVRATLSALTRHLGDGKSPLMLLVVMARQLAQLDLARLYRSEGQSVDVFSRQEGVASFVARKLWPHTKRWEAQELRQATEWAFRIDRAMKTDYGDEEDWLVTWTATVLAQKTPTRGAKGVRY